MHAGLHQLSVTVAAALDLGGAGVTLRMPAGDTHYITATDDITMQVERRQDELQEGACVDAMNSSQIVAVGDLSNTSIAGPNLPPCSGVRLPRCRRRAHPLSGPERRRAESLLQPQPCLDDRGIRGRAAGCRVGRRLPGQRRTAGPVPDARRAVAARVGISHRDRAGQMASSRVGTASARMRPSSCCAAMPGPTARNCTRWPSRSSPETWTSSPASALLDPWFGSC